MNRAEAFAFRKKIESATVKLIDEEALGVIELFPKWSGRAYTAGERVTEGGILYKARQDIAANPTWRPSLTPTLWEPVAQPAEAGTKSNPITAVAGMTYIVGQYYREGDKLYICKRAGMTDGTEITLYYLPSQLIGQYFEEVSAA